VSDKFSNADICELRDREAIRDVLHRHAHGVDRYDAKIMEAVYWPGAIEDHSAYVLPRDEFIAHYLTFRDAMPVESHQLGNILIRIEGDTAKVQTYFQGFTRVAAADGNPAEEFVVSGRYLDRMEKREREWRIAHRKVVYDHFREYSNASEWKASKYMHKINTVGAPNSKDSSYDLFGDSLLRSI
jgi:hypothetical protein